MLAAMNVDNGKRLHAALMPFVGEQLQKKRKVHVAFGNGSKKCGSFVYGRLSAGEGDDEAAMAVDL